MALLNLIRFTVLTLVLSFTSGEVTIVPNVGDLLIKEGASQTIECSTESTKDNLEWDYAKKDDENVKAIFVKQGAKQTSTLEIKNFSAELAGSYSCKVNDGTSVITEEINLVSVAETKKEPTYHFGNTTAELACNVVLSPSEYMVESVTWSKGDMLVSTLPDSDRFEAKDSLVINKPTRDDVGVYTASIKIANVETPYKCNVSFKDEILNIKPTKVEPTYYYGNKTAMLSCSINTAGRTVQNVLWLKNDTPISNLKESDRFMNPDNNTLIIDDPTRDDAGLYIVRITLDGLPPYDCKIMYKAGPFVEDFKKSKNLIEKDNMELQCKVKGYPKPTVTWYKDNAILNISQDHRIELLPLDGYKNARLIIKGIEFSDEGEYACKAFSSYFNETAIKTITVRVKDKLAALWPFLGIVCEVVILCAIIFIYEKRRNKRAEQEENNAQETNGPSLEKKEGLRHRGTPGNPGA
ncbi:neural cell adhesion molecule 1 [Plakobranchus ocellatus]|uniref:Neural cell adhesion molecule 1 n=1 Tax=Plakobranchus ocellatus TaxID=259542 RepID=A0AAV4B1W1_9GAST|nr:neural cell adhesion molecule 1 [Plakobranchus ocellatus]